MPTLIKKHLSEIMRNWTPGNSSDRRTWGEEAAYLWHEDTERMSKMVDLVFEKGIDFADKTSPIKLGNNGRVYNGHHRLVIAKEQGVKWLWVHIVGPEESNDE
jgi:hypothetical protein